MQINKYIVENNYTFHPNTNGVYRKDCSICNKAYVGLTEKSIIVPLNTNNKYYSNGRCE